MMVWFRAVMLPVDTAGALFLPNALPRATTAWLTVTDEELPMLTVLKSLPPSIWTRATSSARSYPTTWAE